MNKNFKTAFENNSNYSATYTEGIEYYTRLADAYNEIQLNTYGETDCGKPLHELIISSDQNFDIEAIKSSGKTVLFINNAIHPGEPCGVDASMMLARDLVTDPKLKSLLDDVVLVIVPYYNIGGTLNRSSHSRVNQIGPEAYGFRGNVKHLDLNRDFVKCDSKNAKSFNLLFNKWKPEIMIDNHTSNGADYQYVMTLIATQKDKLNKHISKHLTEMMLPDLYSIMKKCNYEMTPYVYARTTPDQGIIGFLDLPRYSSGYAAMHNTISFMPETHMLKPYSDRVWSTYQFSLAMLHHIKTHRSAIMKARKLADQDTKNKTIFDIQYALDMDKKEKLSFKGYEAKYKPSEVTGEMRLFYDQNSPYHKEISFYNSYKSTLAVTKPKAYIVPQAYTRIIDRLSWNGVKIERLEKDQIMEVNTYYIESYKDQQAYEGHYLHYDVAVTSKPTKLQITAGDYIVHTDQISNNYIIAMLEPQHPDSFFAWNFMDGILMQKEHFSAYVFEDVAASLLKNNSTLKSDFELKKSEDNEFSKNASAQLNWIYEQSQYYESGYMRYPILRLE